MYATAKTACATKSAAVDTSTNDEMSLAIRKVVDELRLCCQPRDCKMRLHSILWMRLAVSSARAVPSSAIREFSDWRMRSAVSERWLLQHRATGDASKWLGRKSYLDAEDSAIGYTIDEVILGGKLNTADPYTSEWRLKSFGAKKVSMRSTESRSPDQIYGKQLLSLLREFFETSSRKGEMANVSKRKSAGKYNSQISREALVSEIQRRSRELAKYSIDTLKGAVSQLVNCPRGKRGGRAGMEEA